MNHKHNSKNTKTRESPKSFVVQRKQRVSIADYGSVYIKKTQTQVRELYRSKLARRKRYNYKSDPPLSSSGTNMNLVRASLEVNALNERIESEIDKLRNFRDCFLQEKQLEEESRKTSPVAQKSTVRRSRSLQRQRPLLALNMVNSNKQKSKSLVTEKRVKDHKRLDAGCSRCFNDNCNTPRCPSNQCGYCHVDPHHCYCDVYQQQQPYVVNSYIPVGRCTEVYEYPPQSCCCSSPQSSHRCRTDLNTDEVCRYRQESGRCPKPTRSRSRSRECKADTANRANKKKNQTCQCSPDSDKVVKVMVKKKKPQNETNCATTSKEEKMVISNYSPCKQPESEGYCSDTMRMHREYIKMYMKEHAKTVEKLSSQNLSDLEGKRTYMRLHTDTGSDRAKHELNSSYIKSAETFEKSLRDLSQRAEQQQRSNREECLSLNSTGRDSCMNVEKKVSGYRCPVSSSQNSVAEASQQRRKRYLPTQKIGKCHDHSKKERRMPEKKSSLRLNVRSFGKDPDKVYQKQRKAEHESNLRLSTRSQNTDRDQLSQSHYASELEKSIRVKAKKLVERPIRCICSKDPVYNEATVLWNANRSYDTLESERQHVRDTTKVHNLRPVESFKKCVQYKSSACGPDYPSMRVPSKVSHYSQTTEVASMTTYNTCPMSCREMPTQTDPPESAKSSVPAWSNQQPRNVLQMLRKDYSDADFSDHRSESQPEWSSRKIIHSMKRDYRDHDIPPGDSTPRVKALSIQSQKSRKTQHTQHEDFSDAKIPEKSAASDSPEPPSAISKWSASNLFGEPRNIADDSVQNIKIVYSTELVMVNSKVEHVFTRQFNLESPNKLEHPQITPRSKIPAPPLKLGGQSLDYFNRSTSPELEIDSFTPKYVTFDKSIDSIGSTRTPIDWTRLNTINHHNFSDEDPLNNTSRSADELTCQDSSYCDDTVENPNSCIPSQLEDNYSSPPPFHGCPCMYKNYLKLTALCYGKK